FLCTATPPLTSAPPLKSAPPVTSASPVTSAPPLAPAPPLAVPVLSLDEAVAYARRARGTRGRPSSGWPSLTPTEHQVADLAVEGLTNPQIADRLFMSRGTVKTHLAHIYTKLSVANRTELANLKRP
ncbi:helix-turn-helix domain-containing protein, partial [Kribbella solani]|uniref:helix-turn-helix domain-containing protein n=1 Tax=Kribbella solani TaxID=236067 RepID=UPI0029BE9518